MTLEELMSLMVEEAKAEKRMALMIRRCESTVNQDHPAVLKARKEWVKARARVIQAAMLLDPKVLDP